jgi:methylglutaconyl-CoA hydratase
MMAEANTVLTSEKTNGRCTITLHRPEIHNALNDALIDALAEAVQAAGADEQVRYLVIAGEGKSFCAGADLTWMRSVVDASIEESKADAARLVVALEAMIHCPKPVIGRVHGAALGGGMGLVAACDLVVAAPRALFGLTEVRLGLAPAMIFPFLLRKVQRQHLLWAALTGERFRADRALELGLVNEVADDLDRVIDGWAQALMQAGPAGLDAVKQLFDRVPQLSWEQARSFTVELIARLRCGPEGQDGMRAFLERRKPRWIEGPTGSQ